MGQADNTEQVQKLSEVYSEDMHMKMCLGWWNNTFHRLCSSVHRLERGVSALDHFYIATGTDSLVQCRHAQFCSGWATLFSDNTDELQINLKAPMECLDQCGSLMSRWCWY